MTSKCVLQFFNISQFLRMRVTNWPNIGEFSDLIMANNSLSICMLFDNVHFVVLELWNIVRHKIVSCKHVPCLSKFNWLQSYQIIRRGQVSIHLDVFDFCLFVSYGTHGTPIFFRVIVFNATFNNISIILLVVSFVDGGNWRKPPIFRKSLTNFIT